MNESITLRLHLNGWVGTGGVTISLSGTGVDRPYLTRSAKVTKGSTWVQVTAVAGGVGTFVITATVDGASFSVSIPIGGVPELSLFCLSPVQGVDWQAGSVYVAMNIPVATDTLVAMTSSDPSVVPGQFIRVPQGSRRGGFWLGALRPGTVTLTFSYGGKTLVQDLTIVGNGDSGEESTSSAVDPTEAALPEVTATATEPVRLDDSPEPIVTETPQELASPVAAP